MPDATMKAIEYGPKHDVPVVLDSGYQTCLREDPGGGGDFLAENVSVLAMNEEEALALTGVADPLLASDKAPDWVDLVLYRRSCRVIYGRLFRKRIYARNHPPAVTGAGGV